MELIVIQSANIPVFKRYYIEPALRRMDREGLNTLRVEEAVGWIPLRLIPDISGEIRVPESNRVHYVFEAIRDRFVIDDSVTA